MADPVSLVPPAPSAVGGPSGYSPLENAGIPTGTPAGPAPSPAAPAPTPDPDEAAGQAALAKLDPDERAGLEALKNGNGPVPTDPDEAAGAAHVQQSIEALKGAPQADIVNAFRQYKDSLTPAQVQQLGQYFSDSETRVPSLSEVGKGGLGMVSGIFHTLVGLSKVTPVGLMASNAGSLSGGASPKQVASEELGGIKAGIESGGTELAEFARNVVRNGTRAAVWAASKLPGLPNSNPHAPSADIAQFKQAPGSPPPAPPATPLPEANLFGSTPFFSPRNGEAGLRDAADMADQLEAIRQGEGAWNPPGSAFNKETLAKEGVTIDPEVVDAVSGGIQLAAFQALAGLKVVDLAGGGGRVAVMNESGQTVATAVSRSAAQAFIKKSAQVLGNSVSKVGDVGNKAVNATVKGVASLPGKIIEGVKNVVAPNAEKGTGGGVLGGAAALAVEHGWDAIKKLVPHAGPIGAVAGGVAAALKGTALAAKYGGKALASEGGSALVAKTATGALKGAVYGIPLAAGSPDPEQGLSQVIGMGMLGGAGHLTGAAADEALRMGQLGHTEIIQHIRDNPDARVRLNTPGLDNLEAAHQQAMDILSKLNPFQAMLVNATRAFQQSRGISSYVLTPKAAADAGIPEAEGAHNISVRGTDGATHQITAMVLSGDLSKADVVSGSHEPGHAIADYASTAMPNEWNQFLKSIPDAVRQKFEADYADRAKGNAAIEAAMKQPGYMDKELGAEVLGHYLTDSLQPNIKLPFRQGLNRMVGRVLDKMGLSTEPVPGTTPAETKGFGIIPSASLGKISKNIVSKYAADKTLGPTLSEAGSKAAPEVAPQVPAESPLTPQHEAVLAGLRKVIPAKGMLKFDAIAAKVKAGQLLTPAEAELWKGIDEEAVRAGAKPYTPPAQPEIKPAPKPFGHPENPVVLPPPVKTPPAQPEIKPAPKPFGHPENPVVLPPPVSGEPEKPIVPTPGATPTAPKARPATTDEGRLNAAQNIEAGVKELGAAKETTPEQKAAYESLASGGAHEVVYSHAKGEIGGQVERSDVVNSAEARARTNPESQQLSSKLTMLDMRKTKEGRWQQQFFNHDVLGQNMEIAVKAAKAAGLEKEIPYHVGDRGVLPVDHDRFIDDLRKYTENQHNGYKGDGGKLERPSGGKAYIPEETPGYKPQKLSDPKASDFLNLLMGEKPPKTTIVRPKGSYPVHLEHQDIAKANKGVIHPIAGLEYKDIQGRSVANMTDLRDKLAKAGQDVSDMKPVHEWKNAERVMSAKPIAGEPDIAAPVTATTGAGFLPQSKRVPIEIEGPDGKKYSATHDGYQDFTPIGRGIVPQITVNEDVPGVAVKHSTTYGNSLEKAGYKLPKLPEPELHSSNFMPNKSPRAVKEAAVRNDKTGKIYTGPYHAAANMKYLEEKYPGDPGNEARSWGMIDEPAYGMTDGFLTHEGEFLDRTQAFQRALELKQYTPQTHDKGELEAASFYRDQHGVLPFKAHPLVAEPAYLPRRETDMAKTGQAFKDFFSKVTKGEFGKSEKPLEPATSIGSAAPFMDEYANHAGNFDDHIAKSIPTFRETQMKVGNAIAKTYGAGGHVLDIGASEGSFGKTISAMTGGKVKTVSLDPNPDMAKFFRDKSKVPGASYAEEAFHKGFEDGGKEIPAYNPEQRFDVVHESMAFQFISPERAEQIAEAKRLMKPDGVMLTEEKVQNPNWAANEKTKDTQWKDKYFTPEELKAKDQEVGFQQAKQETKAVGMVNNMVTGDSLEAHLKQNFKHVTQYWDSGNFRGYAASDNPAKLNSLVNNMGDMHSQFSTAETPRPVGGAAFMGKRKFKGYVAKESWLDKDGLHPAPDGHEQFAVDWLNQNTDGEYRHSAYDEGDADIRDGNYADLEAHGFSRVANWKDAIQIENSGLKWADISKKGRQDLEDEAFKANKPVILNGRTVIEKPRPDEPAFMGKRKPKGEVGDVNPEKTDYSKYAVSATTTPAGKLSGWVTPDKKFSPLQNAYHEEDLAARSSEWNKKFGTDFKASNNDDLSVRKKALSAGFARVRYIPNGGELHIEASADHWSGLKKTLLTHALDNADAVDRVFISLIGRGGHPVDGVNAKIFTADDPKAAIKDAFDEVTPPTTETAGEPGLIRRARALPEPEPSFMPKRKEERGPVWYSQLSRTIDDKMPNSASGEQVLNIARSGAKADELKWSGLDDFLKGKDKVTKAEVQKYLTDNQLQVKEITKGKSQLNLKFNQEETDHQGTGEEMYDVVAPNGQTRYTGDRRGAMDYIEEDAQTGGNSSKFENYQLPGGENYREMLFQLPKPEKLLTELPSNYEVRFRKDISRYPEGVWTVRNKTSHAGEFGDFVRDPNKEKAVSEALRMINDDNRGDRNRSNFHSNHWDEPNVLAHARINDRVDAEGKPGLFAEELQSDWHQKGRREGYTKTETTKEDAEKRGYSVYKAKSNLGSQAYFADGPEIPRGVTPSTGYDTEAEAWEGLLARLSTHDKHLGVPDAPYKSTWHEMVFRRLVRQAAEDGKDWLGWTTGEQQAERYDLSKQVSAIKIRKHNIGGGFDVDAYTERGGTLPVIDQSVKDVDALADLVGKDLADKAAKQGSGIKTYSGLDLKVGGEGMKGFYDKILVDYANKFGKKFGAKVTDRVIAGEHDASGNKQFDSRERAVRVLDGGGEIYATFKGHHEELVKSYNHLLELEQEHGGSFAKSYVLGDKQPANTVHALTITPEMKDSVLREGVARFMPSRRFHIRPRPDGVPDVLDSIQEHGGLWSPGKTSKGGEYDGYKTAMVGAASVLRRKSGGLRPDIMVRAVQPDHPRITNPDELYDAIKGAVKSRDALRAKQTSDINAGLEKTFRSPVDNSPEDFAAWLISHNLGHLSDSEIQEMGYRWYDAKNRVDIKPPKR